jgi:hypothetical protein
MLSALLKTVQEQFPKSYWIAGVLPMLVFLALNGVLLRYHSPAFKDWLASFNGVEEKTLLYGSILLGVLISAYLLFSLSSVMLEMIEGRRGPLQWISWILLPGQRWILKGIDEKYDEAGIDIDKLRKSLARWQDMLVAARNIGRAPFTKSDKSKLKFTKKVRWLRRMGRRIPPNELENAVARVTQLMSQFETKNGSDLDCARLDLLEMIQFALNRAQYESLRLYNLRQFSFPGARWTFPLSPNPSSVSVIAPTIMGNIGRTMRSYALTRYQLDLDIFWTRLLDTLQRSALPFYAVIQDSKTVVDCMTALVWLTAIFTFTWAGLLYWCFTPASPLEFALVGFGGTLLTLIWYEVACQGYRVFADLIRSSVDLYRFKMLEAFHLSAPLGTDEERELWLRMGQAMGYSSEQTFIYKHPSAS